LSCAGGPQALSREDVARVTAGLSQRSSVFAAWYAGRPIEKLTASDLAHFRQLPEPRTQPEARAGATGHGPTGLLPVDVEGLLRAAPALHIAETRTGAEGRSFFKGRFQ
jgi:hypothetical protein